MKALVIGLGSMGKRRIRCLQSLEINDIVGVDVRHDRRIEAMSKYDISVFPSLTDLWATGKPDIAIISLPPKLHVEAMRECMAHQVSFFVEASVISDGLAEIAARAKEIGLIAAPSSTLYFHPAITKIFQIVRERRLGKISNVLLHSGQYLADWHTYESVSDYYVSDPSTGGAREIVPFEMTWFTKLFGFPSRVAGQYRKTIDIPGAEYIDDTYNILLDYRTYLASITVDVVSRYATRRLTINGSDGQLIWSWDDPVIRIFESSTDTWNDIHYEIENSESGYNNNIGEGMYIRETSAFIEAVLGKGKFPNSLEEDIQVLNLLYSIERSDKLARFIEV